MTTRAIAGLLTASRCYRRRAGYAGDLVSELTRGRPGSVRGDHGATAVEYGLMAALIAVVIVVAVAAFGHNVSDLYNVPSSVFTP
jgi:Flp pilus assembly pilin Flp